MASVFSFLFFAELVQKCRAMYKLEQNLLALIHVYLKYMKTRPASIGINPRPFLEISIKNPKLSCTCNPVPHVEPGMDFEQTTVIVYVV